MLAHLLFVDLASVVMSWFKLVVSLQDLAHMKDELFLDGIRVFSDLESRRDQLILG